ncbi:MAG: aspartyl/glutamyl-tRNA amidotransferase subunit A, partial [Erysipelotrichaceae bacterium]|nr:aspartyl/glutamyl-tRNA amidotransferase subunit A [Erysipelotrichaceae bacterium]
MRIADIINQDGDKRCFDAYQKAQDVQGKLNATITFIDPKDQLEEAKEGKLYKIPVAVKDNYNTKGILTTAGCKILDNYIPVYDATVVKKLKEAGAIMIAKSSMDELAMGGSNLTSIIGPCYNPYDLNRISGGSSGGSAVLTAANVVPIAIGSDTGDSVRKPASFTNTIGVKPTYGRISRYGVIPYASSLDHVGYFTNDVKDAALVLECIAGRDDNDLTTSDLPVPEYSKLLNDDIKGKKILIFKNVVDVIDNQDVLDGFNKVVEGLKERGAIIEEVSFDDTLLKAILPTYYVIANAESSANHSNLDGVRFGHRIEGEDTDQIMINSRTAGFGPLLKKRFIIGSYALFEDNQERIFRKAQKIRRLINDDIYAKLKDADCLLAPASGKPAPLIDNDKDADELSNEY